MTQDADMSPREEAALWCSLLADGPLEEVDREAFENWLQESAEHSKLFDQAASLWGALPLSAEGSEQLTSRSETWQKAVPHKPGARRGYALAMLCIGTVAIIGGSGIFWITSPKVFTSQVGHSQTIALSDGSTVLLDADSRLRVKLTGRERRLWLDKGRAQFRVSHDGRRPFSVVADGHAVVALGTQFTVERIGHRLTVDLVEGQLAGFDSEAAFRAVRSSAGLADAANYRFVGGYRLQWRGDGARASLSTISQDDAVAWTKGRLIFIDEPLRDAVETVNRYTRKSLKIENGVGSDLRVSGIYRAGDINAFLLGVSTTTRLKAKKSPDGWLLQTPE